MIIQKLNVINKSGNKRKKESMERRIRRDIKKGRKKQANQERIDIKFVASVKQYLSNPVPLSKRNYHTNRMTY